jgi:hypothetical protein
LRSDGQSSDDLFMPNLLHATCFPALSTPHTAPPLAAACMPCHPLPHSSPPCITSSWCVHASHTNCWPMGLQQCAPTCPALHL